MKHNKIIFLLILLAGFLLRLYFILISPYSKSSVHTCDICTVGLMAKHILEGEFPLFFYGQYYLGPLEAFVTSIFFIIFGIKMQVIYLSVLLFSMLFIISIYFIGCIIGGKTVGLIAMLYSAFPSSFFFGESVTPAGYHIEVLLLGNLILICALVIAKEEKNIKKNIYYVIMGVLAGLGIWTHYTILYYLLPVGIFLLFNEKITSLFKKGVQTVISGIFASLPFWIFTFKNDFCTFKFPSDAPGRFSFRGIVIEAFLNKITGMFGIGMWHRSILQFLILLVLVLATCVFLFNKKGAILTILFVSVFSIYSFYCSHMSAGGAWWYLIPIISFMPLAFAFFCSKVMSWNKLSGFSIIILVISFNLVDISGLIKRDRIDSERNREVQFSKIDFLEKKGLYRIIGNDRPLREIEFYSKERITGTGLGEGDYFPHEDEVEASDRIAFESGDPSWVYTLSNICSSFKSENGFYFDFKSIPYLKRSISPVSWHAVSNRNILCTKCAFDRNYDSYWESSGAKHTGDYFCIDLGNTYNICSLLMVNTFSCSSFPVGYKIEVSSDNIIWKEVCYMNSPTPLFWSGPRIYWRPVYGRIESYFQPVKARYIRLTQIGNDKNNTWEINEIFVYEYIGVQRFRLRDYIKDLKEIMAFLKREKISFVYADYWLSAKIKKLGKDKINVMVPYNSWKPFRKYMDRKLCLGKGKSVIVAKEDLGELEDILAEFGIGYKKKVFNRYICYYFPLLTRDMPYFMWSGNGIIKHSLKDYSQWLYDSGYYEKALRYYPNNFLAYLKTKKFPSTRFFSKVEKPILFRNGIKFLGYSVRTNKIITGKVIRMEYFWEIMKEPKVPLAMFVYFMKNGRIVFQNDHVLLYQFPKPLNPLPCERFREALKLKIPEDIQPGTYEIIIGLLDEKSHKRVYTEDGDSRKIVGELTVS